jgi:hypothetical protein
MKDTDGIGGPPLRVVRSNFRACPLGLVFFRGVKEAGATLPNVSVVHSALIQTLESLLGASLQGGPLQGGPLQRGPLQSWPLRGGPLSSFNLISSCTCSWWRGRGRVGALCLPTLT